MHGLTDERQQAGRLWQVLPTGLRPLDGDCLAPFPGLRIDYERRIGSIADVRSIRRELGQRCLAMGYPPRLVWRIRVAVNEVATNALVYAGGGTCRVRWDEAGMYVWIADNRAGLDVEGVHRLLKGPRRRGSWKGHGLRIASSYADSVVLATGEKGTQLLLYFRASQGGGYCYGACHPAGA